MRRIADQPHEQPSDVFKRLTDQRSARRSGTLNEGADDALYKNGDQFYVVRQQERFMPRSQGWVTGMKFEITRSKPEFDTYEVKFLVGVGGTGIRKRLLHKAVERGDVRKLG